MQLYEHKLARVIFVFYIPAIYCPPIHFFLLSFFFFSLFFYIPSRRMPANKLSLLLHPYPGISPCLTHLVVWCRFKSRQAKTERHHHAVQCSLLFLFSVLFLFRSSSFEVSKGGRTDARVVESTC